VKVKVTDAVTAPMRKVTSQRRNGFVLPCWEEAVCSPGRRRKKIPIVARSAMAWSMVE
jgi:hypothetical protein